LHKLTSFSEFLTEANDLENLLWGIATKVGELLGFEDCIVYLRHGDKLVQSAAYGIKNPNPREILDPLAIVVGSGIVGAAAATMQPQRVSDTREDPRYISDTFAGCSELAVPIVYQGQVLGVLDSESSTTGRYTSTDESMFVAIATLAAPRIASAMADRDHRHAIHNLRTTEAAYESREERLKKQHNESLTQFASGIAHDFNNLLTTILGNINLAQLQDVPDAVMPLLDNAVDGCVRARNLTKQLQAFVRGDMPRASSEALREVLESSVEFARRSLDINVDLELATDLHPIRFHSGQMAQVFHNLTTNAGQARPGCKLSIRACNTDTAHKRWVDVTFHDDGPGVPERLQQRIFDPYFSTKKDGSGLGLASSYWLMLSHGGSLDLLPTERGACFRVRIPHAEDRTGEQEGSPAP
jgi:two-component system NtrC family sensor kinase